MKLTKKETWELASTKKMNSGDKFELMIYMESGSKCKGGGGKNDAVVGMEFVGDWIEIFIWKKV